MKKLYLKIIIYFFALSYSLGQFSSSLKTARMHEINKDWDAAISIYKDIVNKNPNSFQAIRNLKNIYKKSQRYEEGINFLQYYLDRNPKDIQLNIELGEFYFLNENIEQAKKIWSNGFPYDFKKFNAFFFLSL